MARVLSAVGIALAVFLAVHPGITRRAPTSLIFLRPSAAVASSRSARPKRPSGPKPSGGKPSSSPRFHVSHWIAASRLAPPLLHVADRIVEVARPLADATRNTI
jgi:hypothetical protein